MLNTQSIQDNLEWIKKCRDLYEIACSFNERHHCQHLSSEYRCLEYTKYLSLMPPASEDVIRVLDWGAQFGHVSLLLESKGYDCYPYVLSSDHHSVKHALETYFPGKWISGDSTQKLTLPDSSFDVIVSSGVLEHVHETGSSYTQCLAEFRRVLRPGGYLIIWKLPHSSSLVEIKSDLIGAWSHRHRFTLPGAVELLSLSGFDILRSGVEGILPLSMTSFLRRMPFPLSNLELIFNRLATVHPISVFANDIYIVARAS